MATENYKVSRIIDAAGEATDALRVTTSKMDERNFRRLIIRNESSADFSGTITLQFQPFNSTGDVIADDWQDDEAFTESTVKNLTLHRSGFFRLIAKTGEWTSGSAYVELT